MSQEQTSNAPTNADSQTPVSFSDVSLTTLKSSFNDTYKVSKGSASQVVLGFQSMKDRLQEPTNEYQQTLYPKLKDLSDRLSAKYVETFLTSFGSDVERQVFGANLNGNRNNGSLYRAIPSGVNRNLTYNYAQFGQLMRVLTSRLRFIAQRDSSAVQRYRDSAEENAAYQKLQTSTNSFMTFLTELSNEWNTLVNDTRTRFVPADQQRQPQQSQQSQQSRQQYNSRQNHQSRPYNQSEQSEYSQQRSQYQRSNRTQTERPQTERPQHASGSQSQRTQRPQYKSVRQTDNTDNGGWTKARSTSRNTSSV